MGEALKPPPVHSGEDPRILAGLTTDPNPPKECKGKGAARALAAMVLSPEIGRYLRENDPKALEQALKALEPFGYPDLDALRTKLGL